MTSAGRTPPRLRRRHHITAKMMSTSTMIGPHGTASTQLLDETGCNFGSTSPGSAKGLIVTCGFTRMPGRTEGTTTVTFDEPPGSS